MNETEHLEVVQASLRQLEDRISASGPVAPANIWIDKSFVKGKQYARLRCDRPLPEWGGKKLKHLGRVGCPDHRDWADRVARRNALQEVERRGLLIQSLIEAYRYELWEPPAPDSPDDLAWADQGDQVTIQGQVLTVDAIGRKHIRLLDADGGQWFYEKASGDLQRAMVRY